LAFVEDVLLAPGDDGGEGRFGAADGDRWRSDWPQLTDDLACRELRAAFDFAPDDEGGKHGTLGAEYLQGGRSFIWLLPHEQWALFAGDFLVRRATVRAVDDEEPLPRTLLVGATEQQALGIVTELERMAHTQLLFV